MVVYIEEVAGYIRVSTQEQKMHGISLDAQKQKLEEYAEKHNMKIVEWYMDEGISGRKLIKKRPELQRMIHDAQKGRFKRILFIKLDRFFRSVAEYHECMKLIEPVIWTATEEKYDLSTANGRAFVNMKLTIAELEADQTGERIVIVNDYKVKSGLPLFGTESMPFCYEVKQPKAGEKTKSVGKRNQEIMEDLLAYVMVNHSVRGGMIYINNKYGCNFSYGTVSNALKNEMICGSYKGNPNYCPPYITREMYEKLQTYITRSPRTSPIEHTYIFSGLIKCPCCGLPLKGAMTVRRNKAGDKSRDYGFRCGKYNRDKACAFNKIIFENRFEKMMLEKIENFLDKQELQSIEIKEENHKVSKVDVSALQEELDRLNYSWQKGRIKKVEEYDKKYDSLVEQIEAATAEIKESAETPDYDRIKAILSGNWKEIYKSLDNDHKRAFWRSFVKEINVIWETNRKEITNIIFF